MITPKQFLEHFFRDKTAAYAVARPHLTAVYQKYFGEPLSQRSEGFMPPNLVRAVVEDVHQSGDTAVAITKVSIKNAHLRTRYHLAAIEASWKIVRIDRQCAWCQGKGVSRDVPCQKCKGEGWCDTQNNQIDAV